MGKSSSCRIEGDVLLERAIAGQMSWLLNATKTTEVLGAVSLLVSQDLTKSANYVLERRVRHRRFRVKSLIGGRNGGGEFVVSDNLLFKFEVLEGLDWWR